MIRYQYKQQEGFTLIELMLAMSFIGVLLLAIAVTSIYIMNTYTKGMTIREVNSVGRLITEDIQRTIATSTPFTVSPARTGNSPESLGSKYVVQSGGGRLCTGVYTYAWNYGNTKELGAQTQVSVYNTYSDSNDQIRFVKVSDAGGALCSDINLKITRAYAKDLLAAGDRNLAIQKFTIVSSARDDASGQALYVIDLILGTNDRQQIDVTNTSCRPPTEGSGFEEFCAINQFNIIARAGNRAGGL